ncbi:MAG: hypothetical protein IT430_18325 [Phycisphaerales bacterium]|nr:hypothetical protein [Phycisphaerales bacterium]
MADQPSIRGLINRLKLPQAMARRIAISDLTRRNEPEAIEALIAHLPRETDERALLRLIDYLGEKRCAAAMDALTTIRDNPETPVEIAHAATIACDRIEKGAG